MDLLSEHNQGIIRSTSQDHGFPLPLLSTAAQLYLTAMASGWGDEDDCVLARLYLPGRHDLISQLAKYPVHHQEPSASGNTDVNNIKHILEAVHLVIIAEAMSFSDHLGLDATPIKDVITHSASWSKMFEKAFESLHGARWSVRDYPEIDHIRSNLVNFESSLSIMWQKLTSSSRRLSKRLPPFHIHCTWRLLLCRR